ncbi:MAG: DUF1573 domain-containing protein [Bacteroidota bacterium]
MLGVIALTMIINTFTGGSSSSSDYYSTAEVKPAPKSNLAAANTNNSNSFSPDVSTTFDPSQAQTNAPTTPPEPTAPPTVMSFGESTHDFGTIEQDSENKHVFQFTNNGDNPLIINNARGSCGCTVPNYPKEPIAPGETGEIEVVYKPGKQEGSQTKTVTITANTEPSTTTLNISAFVEKVEG